MTNKHLVHSTVYNVQSNGVMERWNKTMIQKIYKLGKDSMDGWDQTLNYILFAYNTRTHEATQYSLYELVFGRKPKGPLKLWADSIARA